MAIQIERHVVVPDEVVRCNESTGGVEVRSRRERHVDRAKSGMNVAGVVGELSAVESHHDIPVRDPAIDHRDDNCGTPGRLDVPRPLEIDEPQIPLILLVILIGRHHLRVNPI